MARRHYSSNARETSLTAGINSSATTIAVDNPVGYPADTPFIVHCELGTSSEEIMLVTAVVGSNWTVTRGYDGSTAVSHELGAKVVHGVSAIDMDEANAHVNASTNVHGLSGGAAVVGTTSSQTLTNKTITSPTIDGGTWNSPSLSNPTFSGGTLTNTTLVTPTIASFVNAQHDHSDPAGGGTLGGGGSGGFFFGSPATAASPWITPGGAGGNVDGMAITYTAPAAWPTGASAIVYNFSVTVVQNAGSTFGLDFSSDGASILGTFLPFRMEDTSTLQTWTFSWTGALTATGVSHTARVVGTGQGISNSVEFDDRQFWLSLA